MATRVVVFMAAMFSILTLTGIAACSGGINSSPNIVGTWTASSKDISPDPGIYIDITYEFFKDGTYSWLESGQDLSDSGNYSFPDDAHIRFKSPTTSETDTFSLSDDTMTIIKPDGETMTLHRMSSESDSVAPVIFPDANLEATIREVIGKSQGNIYQSDLVALTKLDAGRNIANPTKGPIANLTGLEHCTSLTSLNLSRNQISDLSPLASLTSLTELNLYGNQISDLSSLTSLTSLTSLNLSGNQISSLSSLTSLTSLTSLSLGSNQISDILPLGSLTSLTSLSLGSNQISNLLSLSSLIKLTELNLYGNQISNLLPLSSLTGLNNLHLDGNQISDILPLVNNPGLGQGDYIYLGDNLLNATSVATHIPALEARGAIISY